MGNRKMKDYLNYIFTRLPLKIDDNGKLVKDDETCKNYLIALLINNNVNEEVVANALIG